MAAPFDHTWRALKLDSGRRGSAGLAAAGLILIGWSCWFGAGEVGLFEVSVRTVLEAATSAHPVATRIDGQVIASRLELGRRVEAGEVLVELDATAERLELAESEARLAARQGQAAELRREIEAREVALAAYREAKQTRIEESRASSEEARASARITRSQAAARRTLADRKFVSAESLQEAEAKAEADHAAAAARDAGVQRTAQEAEVEIADRGAVIAELRHDLAEQEGLAGAEGSIAAGVRERIALHRIRAPIAGRLGRVETLPSGAVVRSGQVLASVVPDGPPKVVAWFDGQAVGRLRPGQPAHLHLDGFPWTQYGTVAATVESVGSDPVDNRVRVDLALQPGGSAAIPLGHGQSGVTEVEIGRTTPAELVLRVAGEWLTARRKEETLPTRE